MTQFGHAKNGDVRYLISYYDRNKLCKVYYLNRSSFPNIETAEREVKLLKAYENKKEAKTRVRFKIEPYTIKSAVNKSIK